VDVAAPSARYVAVFRRFPTAADRVLQVVVSGAGVLLGHLRRLRRVTAHAATGSVVAPAAVRRLRRLSVLAVGGGVVSIAFSATKRFVVSAAGTAGVAPILRAIRRFTAEAAGTSYCGTGLQRIRLTGTEAAGTAAVAAASLKRTRLVARSGISIVAHSTLSAAMPGIYDPDAVDFFTRVATNSGTLSSTTADAVNAFVIAAKANGYWSKLSRINLICGDWPAALVPLKIGGGYEAESPIGYSATNYTEATGIVGKGINQNDTVGIDTGYSPVGDDATDWGFFTYVSGTTTTNTYYIGNSRNATPSAFSGIATITNQLWSYIAAASGQGAPAPNPSSGHLGFVGGVANGSRTVQSYRNGSPVGTTATPTYVFLDLPLYVMTRNSPDDGIKFPMGSGQTLRAYAITRGLTSTQVADFSDDLNTFQAALGRNVY
jgi:hypothetical protein